MLFTLLNRQRRDRGFSFIELLAYIAIAALLILAAIPQFSSYREKALVSNMANDVHNASLAVEAARIDLGAKGGDSGVKLASTASTSATTTDAAAIAALTTTVTTAIATVKTSDPGTVISSRSITTSDYVLVATNPKTKNMAIFSSGERAALTLSPGVHIRKSLPADPSAGGSTAPSAPALSADPTVTRLAVPAGPSSFSTIGVSADGKTLYSAGLNVDALDLSAKTWTRQLKVSSRPNDFAVNDAGTAFTTIPSPGGGLHATLRNGVRQDYTVKSTGMTAVSGDTRVVWHLLGGHLYRVTDYGTPTETSTAVKSPPTALSADSMTRLATNYDGQTIVAMGAPSVIYVSQDAGVTWKAGAKGFVTNFSAVEVSRDGRTIVASSGDGAVVSRDGGATWGKLPNPSSTFGGFTDFAMSNDGTVIYTAYAYGTYVTTDSGKSWKSLDVPNPQRVATSADGRTFAVTNNAALLFLGTLS